MSSHYRTNRRMVITSILAMSLMLLGTFAILPLTVHAQSSGTPMLTVISKDTYGNIISGYYTSLSGNGGNVLATAYTPASYALTSGQTYTVAASSFGNCFFQNWADGNTSAVMTVSASSNTQLIAIYNCNVPLISSLTVHSNDENGNPISAFPITLYDSSGSMVSSGFTTGTFATTAGETYTAQVAATFGGCVFVHWADGVTSNSHTFTAFEGPTFMVADYTCAGGSGAGGTSTINVNAINTQGNGITGYYVALFQNGFQINSCFSSCSFTVNNGQTYRLVAESYGSVTFSHWKNDGSTESELIVVPLTSTSISLTAVYSP